MQTFQRLPGSGKNEPRKRLHFDFYSQWSGILGRCKWYDFTLLALEGEFSPYKGSAEVSVALLGFRLTVTYVYDWMFTDEMISLKDEITESLKAGTGAETISDPLGVLDGLKDRAPE